MPRTRNKYSCLRYVFVTFENEGDLEIAVLGQNQYEIKGQNSIERNQTKKHVTNVAAQHTQSKTAWKEQKASEGNKKQHNIKKSIPDIEYQTTKGIIDIPQDTNMKMITTITTQDMMNMNKKVTTKRMNRENS